MGRKRKATKDLVEDQPTPKRKSSRLATKQATISILKKISPGKPATPDTVFWFKYFRETVREDFPGACFRRMTDEELEIDEKRRVLLERKPGRQLHFIVDEANRQSWFVKEVFNGKKATTEMEICKALRKQQIKHVVTAQYFFRGRRTDSCETDSFFLVFPYIKSVTLEQALRADKPLSDVELIRGLRILLGTFDSFQPGPNKTFSLVHGDLKSDQILVEQLPDGTLQWWLIDFGLSDVTFERRLDADAEPLTITLTASKSSGSIQRDDRNRLFMMFLQEVKNRELRGKLLDCWGDGYNDLSYVDRKLQELC